MDCPVSNAESPGCSTSLVDNSREVDHFNRLPDVILVDILDRLPLEDVKSTILLSKRWKNLHRSKTNVEIDYRWYEKTGKKVLPSLLGFLSSLGHQNIHFINASFQYDLSMSTEMQHLIAYVCMKKVEELYVDFDDVKDNRTQGRRQYLPIIIPESGLFHSTVVKLSLLSLQLDALPPGRFEVLKELYLERVMLSENSVKTITCNCSSLTYLCLTNCNPITKLNVVVAENSNLRHLVIKEEFTEISNMSELYIRARDLISIEFGLALPRRWYHLEETLAITEAIIRLNKIDSSHRAMRVTSKGIKGSAAENLMMLLRSLRHVKVLTLCSWCIQVLSVEVILLHTPLIFEAQHLILETGLDSWEFLGIAYMLLGCRELEKLVIVMGSTAKLNFYHMENVRYVSSGPPISFDEVLSHLAVVEFKNYSGKHQTWEDDNFSEALFFAGFDYGSMVVWNLKTCAANLQKMIFTTRKQHFETDQFDNLGDLSSYAPFDCPELPTLYNNLGFWGRRQRRRRRRGHP